MSISPATIDIAIRLAELLATQASALFSRISVAQSGGPPITEADIDAALADVATARRKLVDAQRQIVKPAP